MNNEDAKKRTTRTEAKPRLSVEENSISVFQKILLCLGQSIS